MELQPNLSSWWFQPIWKLCSSNWIISPSRGENKKYLKPPPRNLWFSSEPRVTKVQGDIPELKMLLLPTVLGKVSSHIFRGIFPKRPLQGCANECYEWAVDRIVLQKEMVPFRRNLYNLLNHSPATVTLYTFCSYLLSTEPKKKGDHFCSPSFCKFNLCIFHKLLPLPYLKVGPPRQELVSHHGHSARVRGMRLTPPGSWHRNHIVHLRIVVPIAATPLPWPTNVSFPELQTFWAEMFLLACKNGGKAFQVDFCCTLS